MSFVTAVTGGLLSILYPSLCVGCGRRIENARHPLCTSCTTAFKSVRPERIALVLKRLPVADHGIDTACALWMFEKETALQDLLHTLKYGNRPRFGRPLGRLLGQQYLDDLTRADLLCADLLLPVPLFRSRYLTRGYNQSSQLASGMSDVLDIPVQRGILRRRRSTRSQTNLSRIERWQNVAGAFQTSIPEAVVDRTFLVVDDVLTTGSTVSAAAKTLRAAGANSVHVATLAVARLYEKDRSSRN